MKHRSRGRESRSAPRSPHRPGQRMTGGAPTAPPSPGRGSRSSPPRIGRSGRSEHPGSQPPAAAPHPHQGGGCRTPARSPLALRLWLLHHHAGGIARARCADRGQGWAPSPHHHGQLPGDPDLPHLRPGAHSHRALRLAILCGARPAPRGPVGDWLPVALTEPLGVPPGRGAAGQQPEREAVKAFSLPGLLQAQVRPHPRQSVRPAPLPGAWGQ